MNFVMTKSPVQTPQQRRCDPFGHLTIPEALEPSQRPYSDR